jgi:error-prone DNA polymerase
LFQEQLLRMAMIAAGFTGGQAEELRRAMGFKRSEARMKEIEKQLRHGMEKNSIAPDKQEEIIQSITSFALYGFPESHAASFALLAYASAYLKCHYLAAFTAAMLNNQPMGFYQPATLVKDAQRHGLKVRPIDATCSDWKCTLEPMTDGTFAVCIGLRYVKGLREDVARELVRQRSLRPFASIDDLQLRVPGLQKDGLVTLAEIGALNAITGGPAGHRRDALWQVARAARRPGSLLESIPDSETSGAKAPVSDAPEMSRLKPRPTKLSDPPLAASASPLAPMTLEERLVADFRGTGMTVGPHPMAYHRAELKRQGVRRAIELPKLRDGSYVRVAGSVIARQRPGTAKGFVFLSLEDETGIANAIVTPQLFEREYLLLVREPYLMIEGQLQNLDNTISVKAQRVQALSITRAETVSHDFR